MTVGQNNVPCRAPKTGEMITPRFGRKNRFHAPCTAAAMVIVALTAVAGVAQDKSAAYWVLYSFPAGLTAGGNPQSGLAADADGNLYGTTSIGGNLSSSSCQQGSLGCGVVFKLDRRGQEAVLYAFSGGADGSQPNSGVILDETGNLYGTTPLGGNTGSLCPLGSLGCGVVFRIDRAGKEEILHTFVGPDGAEPTGSLVREKDGRVYGTTFSGGPMGVSCPYNTSCGVVFKLDLHRQSYEAVHVFSGGDDGGDPSAGLMRDTAGNLYGTTVSGGTGTDSSCPLGGFGCGVLFRMDRSGNETVLYNFNGADGYYPEGTLLRDSDGNLYGTTGGGGNQEGICVDFQGCGVVFKVDPTGTETVLYSFRGGGDGAVPTGTLVRDAAGSLYGTAVYGGNTGSSCIYGSRGCGVIFKLDPTGVETVLYTFTGGVDGSNPQSGLLLYEDSLYGTTIGGGADGLGTVFKIGPQVRSKDRKQYRSGTQRERDEDGE